MKISIAPSIELLHSFVDRPGTLRENLAELVDNGLDKDATRVEITATDTNLTVRDNGRGISNWIALLSLGIHEASRQRTLGRFGVGFKHAAIWLAETVDIETRNNNVLIFTRINWTSLAGWDDVDIGEPHPDPGPSYTTLVFSDIRGKRLKNLQGAAEELRYRFGPALTHGSQIVINGVHLKPAPLPEFDAAPLVIDDYFEGKHFHLTAGVKANNATPQRAGYDVAYMHRLVRQRDLSGFGNYSAQRFYGYLELLPDGDEDWSLSDHKDEFSEREELYEYLLPEVTPLLERIAQAKEAIEFRECRLEVNTRMAKLVGKGNKTSKEKRDPGDSHGSVTPRRTGRQRQKAKKTDEDQPGSIIDKLRNRGIEVSFDHNVPGSVGEVQTGNKQIIVSLNPEFEIVKRRIADAIISQALALLVIDDNWYDRNRGWFLQGIEPRDSASVIADYSELLRRVGCITIEGDIADLEVATTSK